MTAGEAVNVWGSVAALSGSLAFVTVYSLLARWWRNPVGRLLVVKALAIAAFMAISVCVTLLRADVELLRTVRGVLAALFGALMLYQAWLVGHTQTRREHVMTQPALDTTRPQIPSVGRVVHYVSHGTPVREDGSQAYTAQCRAAIITEVGDPAGKASGGVVSLAVLNPSGQFFNQGVPHADPEHMAGGTWHFPERV